MEFKLRIATSQHICLTFLKAQHTEKSTESSTSHHKVNISMKSDPHGEPEGHQRPRVGPSSTGAPEPGKDSVTLTSETAMSQGFHIFSFGQCKMALQSASANLHSRKH